MADWDANLIEMKVQGIARDDRQQYVVVLRQGTGEVDEWAGDALPIVVGPAEARAINTELQGVEPLRPMTHDLIRNVLRELDAELLRVVVSDLHDDVFYAILQLRRGDATHEVDARPSDAIALALRVRAPIYVARHVHDQATIPVDNGPPDEQRFRNLMDGLAAEDDFGGE